METILLANQKKRIQIGMFVKNVKRIIMIELTKKEKENLFKFAAAIAFAEECYTYAAPVYKKILVSELKGNRKERKEGERKLLKAFNQMLNY